MAHKSKLPVEYNEFLDAFKGESDRAAAVLAGAYLDAQLERLFRARLLAATPDRLFTMRGVLNDFAGKVDLAFSLGWISRETYEDLHLVRSLRNDFAHDVDHTLSFNSQSVSDRTKNFRKIDFLRNLDASASVSPEIANELRKLSDDSRMRFTLAFSMIKVSLDTIVERTERIEEMADIGYSVTTTPRRIL